MFLTWQLEEMYAEKSKDCMRLRSKKNSEEQLKEVASFTQL